MSPEDLDKARQRLISSSSYKKMVDRVDGNSPFADLDGSSSSSSSRGITEEEEEGGETPGLPFLRQVARASVDVAVALVPVVLAVTFVKFPPPVLEALGSAATAIKASPLEPVRAHAGEGVGGARAHDKRQAPPIVCTEDASFVHEAPKLLFVSGR